MTENKIFSKWKIIKKGMYAFQKRDQIQNGVKSHF